jgi:hypothetical protein
MTCQGDTSDTLHVLFHDQPSHILYGQQYGTEEWMNTDTWSNKCTTVRANNSERGLNEIHWLWFHSVSALEPHRDSSRCQ